MPVVDEKSKQEVEAVRGLLPEKLGEDAIRVIVKEFLLNAVGNMVSIKKYVRKRNNTIFR